MYCVQTKWHTAPAVLHEFFNFQLHLDMIFFNFKQHCHSCWVCAACALLIPKLDFVLGSRFLFYFQSLPSVLFLFESPAPSVSCAYIVSQVTSSSMLSSEIWILRTENYTSPVRKRQHSSINFFHPRPLQKFSSNSASQVMVFFPSFSLISPSLLFLL